MEKIISFREKKNIVVVGAGFAGIACAKKIAKLLKRKNLAKTHSIILIDRNTNHLYSPSLYEIAAIPKNEADAVHLQHAVLIPLDVILKGTGITFLQRKVMSINRFSKTVFFEHDEALDYDTLVVATGSETNFMNNPTIRQYSYPLKTFKDSLVLRNKIEDIVRKKREIKITVAGAGPAGVELIAEFNNYICYLEDHILKEKKCDAHLDLVEGAGSILPGFPEWFMKEAEDRLRHMGVNIRTHSLVTTVTPSEIILQDGAKLSYDIFIWMGGVKGSSVLESIGIPLTKKGSVTVNAFLQPPEDKHIFVIGDSSTYTNPASGASLPWTIPIALAEAEITAKNIIRNTRGASLEAFSPHARYPFILAVGRKYAVADLLYIRLTGLLAWLMKQMVDFHYFLSILPMKTALMLWLRNVRLFSSND